jgi:hypothetical protein
MVGDEEEREEAEGRQTEEAGLSLGVILIPEALEIFSSLQSLSWLCIF